MTARVRQAPLDEAYRYLTEAGVAGRIAEHKRRFGDELVILGHHYQRDAIVQFADFVGDSFKLSRVASQQRTARYVVFCGVHFMAETADMLTPDQVAVLLPHLQAGCTLADMASIDQLEAAWEQLGQLTDATIVPITYVNSSAAIKAFCGAHGGAVCTSGNAPQVLAWAMAGDTPGAPAAGQRKVLFLPDQHLGRNTAWATGWPLESLVTWDPHQPDGGLDRRELAPAKIILWQGECCVHMHFTAEHVRQAHRDGAGWPVIVHPECRWEVVQAADLAGSTEFILQTVRDAPAGSRWAVGTEINLVNRLAREVAPDKQVRCLSGRPSLCKTMFLIDPPHLLWVLDELAAGRVVNRIAVDPDTRRDARVAVERMLELAPSKTTGVKG